MFHSANTPAVFPTEPEETEPSDLRLAVKPRILLIEDNPLIAEMMESALIEEGFRVVGIADTADRAVKLARLYHPDLAVTDIRLAGPHDGIEAAMQIFRETGARSIFATGNLDSVSAGRCAHAKPLGWLTKPYTPSQLVDAVRQAMTSVEVDA
ncbi:response regulator [Ferrovibrio terrae]|uniref:Response regulator n=1 Tax=Ferrovibrio terrae TaxID=2594003 RepID=A0A516H179_9PROT|nr:response regulator [Ferrovibrio terrae]QDO97522.1 response regulator [Ferrovibrio terrae]